MGWSFCAFPWISIRVTTLLGVTNFSEVATSPIIFSCFPSFLLLLSDIRDVKGVNVDGPWLLSACAGVFCIQSASIEGTSTKNTCVRGANAKNASLAQDACFKGVFIGVICLVGSTYVNSADAQSNCVRDAYTRGTYLRAQATNIADNGNCDWTDSACAKCACIKVVFDKSACIENVYAIGRLAMDTQSFQILEVKLFNTWLEIRIGACW